MSHFAILRLGGIALIFARGDPCGIHVRRTHYARRRLHTLTHNTPSDYRSTGILEPSCGSVL